jgi:hypothetical protein
VHCSYSKKHFKFKNVLQLFEKAQTKNVNELVFIFYLLTFIFFCIKINII